MQQLTLAQRLLARIGQLSQRSDVIVQQQSTSRPGGKRISKWQDKLPADMYAFYQAINGLKFHYSFTDTPDDYHGLEFLALEEDGRKVIDTFRNIYRIPHQVVRKYPEHFFQEDAVEPNTPVLFFFGDDSGWGIVMTGEGANATFHHWDNDGFLRPLGSSFTDLVDRLINRGFAHTWAYSDTHPDTDAVLARLAQPVALRKTFDVTVEALDERSATDTRTSLIKSWPDGMHDKVLRALGMTKQAKEVSPMEKVSLIEKACSSLEPITEKVATSVMSALGYRKRNREQFGAYFRCDAGPVALVKLRVEYINGPIPLQPFSETLLRVLHGVDEFHITEGSPCPPEAIAYTNLRRHAIEWDPLISCSWDFEFKGKVNKFATFDIAMDAERARGMQVGKTYASTALPSVEGRIG